MRATEPGAGRPLEAGDVVELLAAVPGHRVLKPGLQGVVVVGAGDGPPNMVSVLFARTGGRVWLLHQRHVRRVTGKPGGGR